MLLLQIVNIMFLHLLHKVMDKIKHEVYFKSPFSSTRFFFLELFSVIRMLHGPDVKQMISNRKLEESKEIKMHCLI